MTKNTIILFQFVVTHCFLKCTPVYKKIIIIQITQEIDKKASFYFRYEDYS